MSSYNISKLNNLNINSKSFDELKKMYNSPNQSSEDKNIFNSIFSKGTEKAKEIFDYIDALDGKAGDGITTNGLKELEMKDGKAGLSDSDFDFLYKDLNLTANTNTNQEVDKELFPDGTKNINLQQGRLNDCWFLSALNSVSANDPDIISQSIKKIAKDEYMVKFKGATNPVYVNKNEIDMRNTYPNTERHVDGPLGIQLMEAAVGKIQKAQSFNPKLFKDPYPADELMRGGGMGSHALALLTGDKTGYYLQSEYCESFSSSSSKLTDTNYNNSKFISSKDILNTIKNPDNYLITANINAYKNLPGLDEQSTEIKCLNGNSIVIELGHEYSVEKITDKSITIVNPWDTSEKGEMTHADFEKYFGALTIFKKPELVDSENAITSLNKSMQQSQTSKTTNYGLKDYLKFSDDNAKNGVRNADIDALVCKATGYKSVDELKQAVDFAQSYADSTIDANGKPKAKGCWSGIEDALKKQYPQYASGRPNSAYAEGLNNSGFNLKANLNSID